MSVIWGSDRRWHVWRAARSACVLLIGASLCVPPAEAQLRDVLDDLLGRSSEIESVVELEEPSDEAVAFFRVVYADVDDPGEVELSVRVLDRSMRSLRGFENGTADLEASEGEVDVDVFFTGPGEVTSEAVEVRLKRRGRTFAKKIVPLRRNWGTPAVSGTSGDGLESGEENPVVDGGVIVLSPIPVGNTPSNTSGSAGSSGRASGSTSSGRGVARTPPTGGTTAANSACRRAVQGKIAWDYSGTKTWMAPNIERLCRGATASEEPARCFDRVMHGGVNWGGGTQWSWENAIDLCEGSTNAGATINCFTARLQGGEGWGKAIASCGK